MKREGSPQHHPLARFLEEEQVRQQVAERSYTLQDVQEVVYAEGDDGWEEGFESLFFDYAESMRAVVLGTRAG